MYNKIDAKVYISEKNIPVATTLIYINQCNTDKQSLEEKIGDVDKKIFSLKHKTCHISNKIRIKSRTRYNSETSGVWLKLF